MLWNLTLNVSNNGPQIIILCSTMQIMWARSHEYTLFLHRTQLIISSISVYFTKLMFMR